MEANAAEHAPDERIDHIERRNIDQHSTGVQFNDLVSQVVLQRHRDPVVHIDLDRDKEEVTQFENWDSFHKNL